MRFHFFAEALEDEERSIRFLLSDIRIRSINFVSQVVGCFPYLVKTIIFLRCWLCLQYTGKMSTTVYLKILRFDVSW